MTSPLAAKILFTPRFFEVAAPLKPYYNPVNLEKAGTGVKQKEFIHASAKPQRCSRPCASAKSRAASGFLLPRCAPGKRWASSRLCAPKAAIASIHEADVRLLQRAIFLRRARGLNPAAIVHVLKRQGVVSSTRSPGAFPASVSGACARAADFPSRRWRAPPAYPWDFSAPRARPDALVDRHAPPHRPLLSHQHSFALRNRRRKSPPRSPRAAKNPGNYPGVRMELLAWGNTAMEPHLFRVKPGGGSGESYSHEGEEFLHILRGDFEIWLDSKEHYRLKPGDSLYFESSTPHRWKNPGERKPGCCGSTRRQHFRFQGDECG